MPVGRVSALIVGAVALSTTLSAQIPTRRGAAQPAAAAPRLLVGNPHSFSQQDSAAAIAIGEGMRQRIDKVVNSQFRVLTRKEMNDALTQFGYPADAILHVAPQRSLAQALNARVMVYTTLTHQGNRYVATARLAGLTDEAGNVVVKTQEAGQSPAEFGASLADGFTGVFKSWNESRGCVDNIRVSADKAAQAAKKAIQNVPNHGLANYCLGQLALEEGTASDSAKAMKYFQTATKGDPLSLAAWTQLAAGYESAGDTTQTIAALRQMLLIAPTNQPLRELAFKKFLAYGQPEIAEQVADEGLQIDPSNTDLFELRANARIFRENYSGALDDLEAIVALDSTRADTTFYVKYIVTASQKPDTARLVAWVSRGVRQFPGNMTILSQAAAAYSMVGLPDSIPSVLNLLLPMDSAAAVGLALQEAKNQQDAKQPARSLPFIEFAAAHGDATARESAAGLLLNASLPLLQPPTQDFNAAADGLRRVVQLADPHGRYAPIANHFLGLSLVNLISQTDPQAEKEKSCDLARKVETMTAEAEAALAAATGYEQQADARARLLQYLGGLKPRTASMLKVYCK